MGSKDAVIVNLSDFSERVFLRNAIKSKNRVHALKDFFQFPDELFVKTAIKSEI